MQDRLTSAEIFEDGLKKILERSDPLSPRINILDLRTMAEASLELGNRAKLDEAEPEAHAPTPVQFVTALDDAMHLECSISGFWTISSRKTQRNEIHLFVGPGSDWIAFVTMDWHKETGEERVTHVHIKVDANWSIAKQIAEVCRRLGVEVE